MSRIAPLLLLPFLSKSRACVYRSVNGSGTQGQWRFLSGRAGGTGDELKGSWPTENNLLTVNISYPAYMMWGANTDVGKTLISAGLSASILSKRSKDKTTAIDILYIKPVQTGFPTDSDARFVTQQVLNIMKTRQKQSQNRLYISNQTLKVSPAVCQALNSIAKDIVGMKDMGSYEEHILDGPNELINGLDKLELDNHESDTDTGFAKDVVRDHISSTSRLTCKTLWAWFDPVSPHLVAETERTPVKDSSVLHTLISSLQTFVDKKTEEHGEKGGTTRWAVIETAGGVASPGPSGNLQCDIYRPLRLPGVLVGDGRLGGISSTISAFESLHARGYDVEAVILLESGLMNEQALRQYFQGRMPVLVLSQVPTDCSEGLGEWYAQSEEVFSELQSILEDAHVRRIQRLKEMPTKAEQILWWPFTQHTMVPIRDIAVIDSRSGHSFSVYKNAEGKQGDVLVQQFDACASWWTQGPDTHLQAYLAREAGYAAGRYGHVMFPENVYEPALHCAELLLQGVGKGWAKRVFYSDNGSTAVEIALKMAFRKFVSDHGLLGESDKTFATSNTKVQLKVLALRGSYHGDTLGAMEAQAPSTFTGFLQQPWYSGRGLFLDPPTVHLQSGRWLLKCPASFGNGANIQDVDFKGRADVFDLERDRSSLNDLYHRVINEQLSVQKSEDLTSTVAALILEPVIHGSGGMEMVDPLFQRTLVAKCRSQNIPVIFDEVFTGFWRLGVESAAELLNCHPDIACYAKLLTGGTIPLAATLATEAVFEVFTGKSKLEALLHGHSYTAHALGCATAATSLKYFCDPLRNPNLLADGQLRELWDPELVSNISSMPSIRRVISLGTVFACELQASAEESGYASTSAKDIIRSLRLDGIYARPLGNVVYLMCGPLTPPQTCRALLETLHNHLGLVIQSRNEFHVSATKSTLLRA